MLIELHLGTSIGTVYLGVRLPLDFNVNVNGIQTDIRLFNSVAMHVHKTGGSSTSSALVVIMEKNDQASELVLIRSDFS